MKNYLTLMLFIFVGLPSYGIPDEEDFQRIDEEISKIDQRFDCEEPRENLKDKVLCIGPKGSGKTTLMTYLQNIPLEAGPERNFGRYIIKRRDGIEGGIAHGSIQGTKDPVLHGSYWDCPGFNLVFSEDPVQDIVNAYNIYKLTSVLSKPRILIVSSVDELRSARSEPFLNMLCRVGYFLPKDGETFSQHVCLVITKSSKEYPQEEICRDFGKLKEEQLPEHLGGMTRFYHSAIDSISELKENQLTIFPEPQKRGALSEEWKDPIERGIKHTKPLPDNFIPRLPLADGTYSYIADKASLCNRKILDTLQRLPNHLSQALDKYVRRYMQQHPDDKASDLRNEFQDIWMKARRLSNTEEMFFEDAHIIKNTLERLDIDKDIRTRFESYVKMLMIFDRVRHVDRPIEKSTDSWRPFLDVVQFLSHLASEPEHLFNNGVLTLKGFLIGTSDFQREAGRILALSEPISEGEIYSLYGVMIDENLEYPQVNFSILSPHWWVTGKNKVINLKGEDGPDFEGSAAVGNHGLPGEPGKSGGNFYGVGRTFHNEGHLVIDVRGGKGGRGQDGGIGLQGKAGEDKRNDVQQRRKECLIKRIPIDMPWHRKYLTANKRFKEVYRSDGPHGNHGISGTPGEIGGGRGRGGLGGFSGNIHLKKNLGEEVKCRRQLRKGEDGEPGSFGEGGPGGSTSIYEGTYINESIFATLRGKIGLGAAAGVGVGSIAGGIGAAAAGGGSAVVGGAAASTVAGGGAASMVAAGVSASAVGGIVTAVVVPLLVGSHTLASWVAAEISSDWEEKPHLIREKRADQGARGNFTNPEGPKDPDVQKPIKTEKK